MIATRASSRVRAFTLVEILVVIGIITILVGIVLAVGSALGQSTEVKRTQSTMEIMERALSEWERSANRDLRWGTNGYLGDGQAFVGATYDMQAFEPGPPGNASNLRKHIYTATELIGVIGRTSDVQSLLAQVNQKDFLKYNSNSSTVPEWIRNVPANEPDGNSGNWQAEFNSGRWDPTPAAPYGVVLDGWNIPIRFVHAGRKWRDGDIFSDLQADPDGTVRTPMERIYGAAQNGLGYFVSSGPDREFGDRAAATGTPMYEATLDNVYSAEVINP